MKFSITIISVLFIIANAISGEKHSSEMKESLWSVRIADSFLLRHPNNVTYDTGAPSTKWNYEQGLMLKALYKLWLASGDKRYFDFTKKNLDQYVDEKGAIKTYEITDYNLDNVAPGSILLAIYEATNQTKYKIAVDSLRKQLLDQPRTKEGGFWHKKIYPYQMWLDGLYMAEPFYTKYALIFNEPEAFDDIANQFIWMAQHARDSKTGLFCHAWDESKQQRWANTETGCSPNFWARAMGWYAMALVDVLDDFPTTHPKRLELISILKNLSEAVLKFRDEKTHLWYQVVDQENHKGNYLETSSSCMFAYSFAKGANKGYLDKKFLKIAEETFKGVVEYKATINENGFIDLHGTCRSAGLGGKPYRDGSFEYYISEPQRTNDMKGIGSFLLAAIELEKSKKITTNSNNDIKGKNRK